MSASSQQVIRSVTVSPILPGIWCPGTRRHFYPHGVAQGWRFTYVVLQQIPLIYKQTDVFNQNQKSKENEENCLTGYCLPG